MTYNENLFIPQGWQCPICKRVYSPTTSLCLYCGNEHHKTNTITLETQGIFGNMRDFTQKEREENETDN